jgi:hypothetical protein
MAEVSVQKAAQVSHVLDRYGLIQPQLVAKRHLVHRPGLFSQHDLHRVPRYKVDDEKYYSDHPYDHRDKQAQSSQNVSSQSS